MVVVALFVAEYKCMSFNLSHVDEFGTKLWEIVSKFRCF